MTGDGRAPSGQALVQAPSPAVSALTGFDPSRLGGTTAPNYDAEYEASFMLRRLSLEQRDFILRMRPVKADQRLSARDWREINPCIETGDDWPWCVWFGGMRACSGAGQKGWTRTFRFNDAGLLLRQAIAMEARQGGDAEERLHAKHDSAAIAQGGDA